MHTLLFRATEEAQPGPKWQASFREFWPAYRQWFLREGDSARPSYGTSVRMLRKYMPELVRTYDRMVELAGGTDEVARFLSLYCPTPYLSGCSQAIWCRGEPALIRNYDYSPRLCEGSIWYTAWTGRRVVAMSDCLWGVLDGWNDAGLAVALSFGGRKVVGTGFGIPLVLRYILELCSTTKEAAEVLRYVPVHMAYNVAVVDRDANPLTVLLSPDRPPTFRPSGVATNHQKAVEWHEHATATGSVERERLLAARLADRNETLERFAERFLEPPVYSTAYDRAFGTLYSAIYWPTRGVAEYRWPHQRLPVSMDGFREQALQIDYVDPTAQQRTGS